MAHDKPVWRYWLNLAEVPLEDAICLSLNVEPSILQQLDEEYLSADRAEMLKTFRPHFIARRDAARTHIRASALPARYDQFKKAHMVRLPDFRLWGEGLPAPFTFPEEFPKPPPAPKSVAIEAPAKNESSPRNENANLRIIAAMLALLRDQDGRGFPSDAKVIDVLVEKYGAADGVSKRNLEAVFPAAKRIAGDDLKPQTRHRK